MLQPDFRGESDAQEADVVDYWGGDGGDEEEDAGDEEEEDAEPVV